MSSSILHELTSDKRLGHIPLPILEAIYPRDLVCQVLSETGCWEKRERKLSHVFMLYLLIAWTLLPLTALKHVCSQLCSALRWLSPSSPLPLPSASALCYRRQRLGVGPLQRLMHCACHPLCQPTTPGAFLFGRRLIAIDSKLFDVADTPDNDKTFRGRDSDDQPRRHTPFPQIRLLSALEIGSHAHVAAVLAPGYCSEMSLVEQLLGWLPAHSLVLQDSGFRGAWWLQRLVAHGHDTITRLQSTDYPCKGPRLSDGSYLITTSGSSDAPTQEPLVLRIIEYRLTAQVAQPLAQLRKSRVHSGTQVSKGAEQVYRLATTLLDPQRFAAREIAACYHERWELELVYDELQEHQMSVPRVQSKTSTTVLQEVWALLLGHYALRAWMMQAASQEDGLDVDRLSFTQALCVLGTALTLSTPLQQVSSEQWKPRVLADLRQADRLLPPRRLRCYPRVVKAARTRFFVKRASDRPFVADDPTLTWNDVLVLLGVPEQVPLPLLI